MGRCQSKHDEIEPCPFCNNTDKNFFDIGCLVEETKDRITYKSGVVRCAYCGAFGPEADGPEEALTLWNDWSLNKNKAITIAFCYGGIDGGHHKQWVIDQMLQALLGSRYDEWVAGWESQKGYEGLKWDTGVAPSLQPIPTMVGETIEGDNIRGQTRHERHYRS